MELSPYVERLREELAASAAGGTAEVQDAAQRLNRALDSAVRLTLCELLADAAAEITSSLPSGSVSARLSGRGVDLIVDPGPPDLPTPTLIPTPGAPGPSGAAGTAGPADASEDGDLARITVRLPEGIKERAEAQAGRLGQSLNSWIVKTIRQATSPEGLEVDLSQRPAFDRYFPHGEGGRGRLSGWV